MSLPLAILRRSRPTGSPAVGREAFPTAQGRGAALARMLCALFVLVSCLATPHRHQPAHLTWQDAAATTDTASRAAASAPVIEAADALSEDAEDHEAFDHVHGADSALAPRDVAVRPPLVASSRPLPQHIFSLTPQARPLAPTPPPRLPITRFPVV